MKEARSCISKYRLQYFKSVDCALYTHNHNYLHTQTTKSTNYGQRTQLLYTVRDYKQGRSGGSSFIFQTSKFRVYTVAIPDYVN